MQSTILVVDDDSYQLQLLDLALSDLPARVIARSDGLSAVEAAKDNDVDVVLLDMIMPGIDGLEVARRLRAATRSPIPRIVMISGVDSVAARIAAYGAGVDDFIVKPCDQSELFAKLSSHLQTVRALRSVMTPQGGPVGAAASADRYLGERRFAEIGYRCAGLIHDVRGALATIHASLGLMARDGYDNSDLTRARRAADRLRGIVASPMAYIGGDDAALDATPINLRDLARSELDLLADYLKNDGITTRLTIDSGLEIHGNAVLLARVLGNLFRNAIDAMRGRPERLLEVGAELSENERSVTIVIADTGRGMSTQALEHLFDGGARKAGPGAADALSSRAGLGLSLVQGLVSELKGELSVDSQEGVGSRFRVRFALAQTDGQRAA